MWSKNMEEKTNILKFKELTHEESRIINPLYKEGSLSRNCVHIGPKGYVFVKTFEKYAADIYNMELKEGDIFVTSYQRSGTTMTQELVWLLASNLDYTNTEALGKRYKFLELASYYYEPEVKDFMEKSGNREKAREFIEYVTIPATKLLADIPSPRFIKTHLPMSFLPPKLLDTAKVVYVARDPRDVAVSSYHHSKLFTLLNFKGSFKELWTAFRKDLFTLNPYFEHVKEAWAQRNHPNMLFLFYEDLVKDLPGSIRRVSDFLGKSMTPKQMERLSNHLRIDNFKNNISLNFEDTREFGFLASAETFIRKGKTGGWREYFDEEMQRDAERWIADNLRDTDLRYPGMQLEL